MTDFIVDTLSRTQFEQMIAGAHVLEDDGFSGKVLLSRQGKILKLFKAKRRCSSNLWDPYALRFARHAAMLRSRGITAPFVESVFNILESNYQIVVYTRLEGQTLRQKLQGEPILRRRRELLKCLARFVADLHARGILFSSLHFGNILVCPSKNWALIDVTDVKIYDRALNVWRRLRNFRHLSRYAEDRAWIDECPRSEFLKIYTASAPWNGLSRWIFSQRMLSDVL